MIIQCGDASTFNILGTSIGNMVKISFLFISDAIIISNYDTLFSQEIHKDLKTRMGVIKLALVFVTLVSFANGRSTEKRTESKLFKSKLKFVTQL